MFSYYMLKYKVFVQCCWCTAGNSFFTVCVHYPLERKPSIADANNQSRIPVRSPETQSPSPAKKAITGGVSPKNSPTNSQHSTPTKRKLPTPGGVGQVVKEPVQRMAVESKRQSRPWELPVDQDSDVCCFILI